MKLSNFIYEYIQYDHSINNNVAHSILYPKGGTLNILRNTSLNKILWIYNNDKAYYNYLPIGYNELPTSGPIINQYYDIIDSIKKIHLFTMENLENDELLKLFKGIYDDLRVSKDLNKLTYDKYVNEFVEYYWQNDQTGFEENFKKTLLEHLNLIIRIYFKGLNEQEILIAPGSVIQIKKILLYQEDITKDLKTFLRKIFSNKSIHL